MLEAVQAGMVLGSKYSVKRKLGEGGFGKAFLVEDSQGRRYVAKQLSPEGNSLKTAKRLFRKEAEILKQVGTHQQIPSFIEMIEAGEELYIVQEFIPGENLEQILKREGSFSEDKVLEMLESLLSIVEYLHSSNMIHRDIKPANIIRRQPDNELVLVDFGVSKRASQTALAHTETKVGTASYAPLEQLRGKTTFASDIFSLGMTCIHLLTGTDPKDIAESPTEGTLEWRLEMSGRSVRKEFAAVLDKMTEEKQQLRCGSAKEVKQALKDADAAEIIKKKKQAANKLARIQSFKRIAISSCLGFAVTSGCYGIYTQRAGISSYLASKMVTTEAGSEVRSYEEHQELMQQRMEKREINALLKEAEELAESPGSETEVAQKINELLKEAEELNLQQTKRKAIQQAEKQEEDEIARQRRNEELRSPWFLMFLFIFGGGSILMVCAIFNAIVDIFD